MWRLAKHSHTPANAALRRDYRLRATRPLNKCPAGRPIPEEPGKTPGLMCEAVSKMKLANFGARLPTFEGRRAPAPPKEAQSIYQTPAYRIWREAVIARAGRRCEAVVNGKRCWKAEPRNRMFADHKVEVRDGGSLYDEANGECLCGAHHSAKTALAKAARRSS